MIQFNKTIFQFAKRLALIAVLIGVTSTAWGADYLVTKPVPGSTETNITVKTNVDEGKVYIKHTALGNESEGTEDSSEQSLGIQPTQQGPDESVRDIPWIGWLLYPALEYYASQNGYATPDYTQDITLGAEDISSKGYVFDGWYTITTESGEEVWTELKDANNLHITSLETTITINLEDPFATTFGAKWLKPKVIGTDIDLDNNIDPVVPATIYFGTITNPEMNPSPSKDGRFIIDLYKDTSNYIVRFKTDEFTSENFRYNSASSLDKENNIYTLPIKFVPTGVHRPEGTTSGVTGLAILESKVREESLYNEENDSWNIYEDGELIATDEYWKYIKLVAYEDYTPSFTVKFPDKENATDDDYYTFPNDATIGGSATSDSDIYPVLNNYAARQSIGTNKGTSWKYNIISLTDGTNSYPTEWFNITDKNGGQPTITFSPKANNNFGFEDGKWGEKILYAKMSVQCTYYDALGNSVPSDVQYSLIKVKVIQEDKSILEFRDSDIKDGIFDFGTITIGEMVETTRLDLYYANIDFGEEACTLGNDELFEVAPLPNNGQVVVNIPNTDVCAGEYTTTLTITGTPTSDNVASNEATITLKARFELAKPELKGAGSNNQVTFGWAKVPGADFYKVFIGTSEDGLTEISEPNIQEQAGTQYLYYVHENGVENGVPIYCQIIAFQNCNTSAGKASDIVSALPAMDKIDNGNKATTGIWTGIPGDALEAPEGRNAGSLHRQVDVTDAFNIGGEPIFDVLYIFGETTANGAARITKENAITPLYVFEKNTTDKCYDLVRADENASNTIANMRTTRNATYQTINLNNKDISSIYFTGYCPFAFIDETKDNDIANNDVTEDGVIHIIGHSKNIDLYLNDLQIYAMDNEESHILNEETLDQIKTNGYYYETPGSGAVFAFQPMGSGDANMLNINLHIQNEVILDAAKGAYIDIDMSAEINGDMQILIDDTPDHSSSPIQILARGGSYSSSVSSTITIDDLWNNGTTNTRKVASLKLTENQDEGNNAGISIDLGNAQTKLVIDGVNIITQPIAAAFTLQEYPETSNTKWYARGIKAKTTNADYKRDYIIGVGASLHIKDGTISGNGEEEIRWYVSNLIVDGGSYNTPIAHYSKDNASSATTPIYNSYGTSVKRAEIDFTTEESVSYGKIIKDINLVEVSNFDKMVDDLFPDFGFNIDQNTHKPLSAYYSLTTTNGRKYGYSSLYADNTKKIHPMLPNLTCSSVHIPWLICAPEFILKYNNQNINWGGGIKNATRCSSPEHTTTAYNVDNLLFTEIDAYTKSALDRKYFTTLITGGADISIPENKGLYSTIGNTDSYTIQNKVYMMKPIVAAKWMLFTAPFDIKKVSVIESYPERQLALDHDAVRGKIPEDKVLEARKAQAERFVEFYSFWYANATGATGNVNLDPNDENSIIAQWIAYESGKGKGGIANQTDEEREKYKPSITELVHYTGDPNGAHYYLYQSNGEWKYEKNHFTTTWSNAEIGDDGIIMQRGHVYAIYFPYNSYSGVHDPSTSWDYWTGKYLLLESKDGPIEINGSSSQTPDAINSGVAKLCGNSSFTDIVNVNLPQNTSFWSLEKNPEGVENNTGRDIHDFIEGVNPLSPTEGYLLANFVSPANMRAIAINYRTGQITYEKIEDENPDDNNPGLGSGVPTIMGDLSLMVVPTPEGLTITPLKEQHVMLFDAEGKMIFSKYMSEEENVSLPTGVYVVRGEYEQVKAIKK